MGVLPQRLQLVVLRCEWVSIIFTLADYPYVARVRVLDFDLDLLALPLGFHDLPLDSNAESCSDLSDFLPVAQRFEGDDL